MSATACAVSVECLRFEPLSIRAKQMLTALSRAAASAGVSCADTKRYEGAADWLLLWGPGAPSRFEPMRQQIARGGHVLALDLAYWERETKVRISIDAAHPQSWVMKRDWPADRLAADRPLIADRWNPTGPVIVAGIGRKARAQYGGDVDAWERQMIAAAVARWPERRVFYRAKQADAPVPQGVARAGSRPINDVLSGASLLITWHSNVAVDAIRLGIPVICRDGAASAVCASSFEPNDPRPLASDVRDRFLRNLAWFQWEPCEARACWSWLTEVLS